MGPREQERIRNHATWLNNLSMASFTVGSLGPLFSAIGPDDISYGIAHVVRELPGYLTSTTRGQLIVAFFVMGGVFRLAAWKTLGRLPEA